MSNTFIFYLSNNYLQIIFVNQVNMLLMIKTMNRTFGFPVQRIIIKMYLSSADIYHICKKLFILVIYSKVYIWITVGI